VLLAAFVCLGPHANLDATEHDCATLAQQQFSLKQSAYKSKPDDPQNASEFGRACFDLAEFATTKTQRAELAEQGIEACRKLLAKASNSAPGHYYLALNLGQLARTRTFGALKLVNQMEREFTSAIELDPHLDHAGPDRSLGMLYRDAPSIGSIGNRTKARQHLEHAIELAPAYPDNRLTLLESCLKWSDKDCARRELKALKELWTQAHQELSATSWNCDWQDWETRLQKAEKKLEEGSKTLESPRTKGDG
jgi:tetratricopeptide (TPR) repeat protein